MEVAVTIGPENELDDACRRAGTEALRVHGELHPVEADGAAP